MMKVNRRKAKNNFDPASVASNTFSDYSGAQKISDVGHKLRPLTDDTTTAITAKKVGKGISLAIYNNGALATITMGGSTVASLAAGVVDANGKVGVVLKANDWTYVNTYEDDYIITSSASAIVYLIADDTYLENRASE